MPVRLWDSTEIREKERKKVHCKAGGSQGQRFVKARGDRADHRFTGCVKKFSGVVGSLREQRREKPASSISEAGRSGTKNEYSRIPRPWRPHSDPVVYSRRTADVITTSTATQGAGHVDIVHGPPSAQSLPDHVAHYLGEEPSCQALSPVRSKRLPPLTQSIEIATR